ncbi:MAG: hypothetical protein ACKOAF_07670, partial [Actinomycetes bacterium]
METTWSELPGAESDVIDLCRGLIRLESSTFGDSPLNVGEDDAAAYAAEMLRDAGWQPEVFATTDSSRRGVHLRIPGTDPSSGALLLHGHLDVVPAI